MTEVGASRSYRPVSIAGEAVRLAGVLFLAGSVAACSMSFPMTSLVQDEPLTTQSTAARAVSPLSAELGEEDWRRARAAMAVALDPQGAGSQVSWDNPDTTMRGHFAPVGQPYVEDDDICRAFLATVVGQSSTSSVQGIACRPSGEEWAIKSVRPHKKA